MKKSLITFSNHVYAWLKDATKTGKKSIYIDGLIVRRCKEIEKSLSVIDLAGIETSAIISALDINLKTLPTIGARSTVMARRLPQIAHTLDGNEALAYAISVICEEIQSGNIGLLKKIEEKQK